MTENDSNQDGSDGGVEVLKAKPKLKRPPLYSVVLINDDYTPMDFVVKILQLFFMMDREKAMHIMLQIHTKGKGICGTYSHDIAETKVSQVNIYSRQNNHPLLCTMERA